MFVPADLALRAGGGQRRGAAGPPSGSWRPRAAPLLSSLVVITAYLIFAGAGPAPTAAAGRAAAWLGDHGRGAGAGAGHAGAAVPARPAAAAAAAVRRRRPAGDRDRIAAAGLVGLVLQQVSVLVINWATQQTGDQGALTRFTWANAIYLLPYAVLAAPLLQLAFPRLAAAAEAGADAGPRGARRDRPGDRGAGLARVRRCWWPPRCRWPGCSCSGPGSGRTAALAGPIVGVRPGGGRLRPAGAGLPHPAGPAPRPGRPA